MSDPVLVANVIGLQAALDAKAASSHTHAIADTTGLQVALDAKASITNRREYFPTIANGTDTEHDLDIGAARIWVSDGTTERLVDFATETIAIDGAGLDAGTVANATWYYIWSFYNPTTDDSLNLLSASTTAPTAPSGYTFKRFLCEQIAAALLTNGSANLYQFVADKNRFKFADSSLLTDFNNLSPATSRTTITVSAPAIVCRYLCRLAINSTSSGNFVKLLDRDADESEILYMPIANATAFQIGAVRARGGQIDYIASTASDWWTLNFRALGYEV